MSAVEIEILRAATIVGAVVQNAGGGNAQEIANLEALGFLRCNPVRSNPKLGTRYLEITAEGRAALASLGQ